MSALTPAAVTLQAGQQNQFAVSVTGSTDTTVVWNIVDSSGQSHLSGDSIVGTISAAGLYQAPATTTAFGITLYAGAAANTSISRTASITVNPLALPVSVSITPTNAGVATCIATPCPSASMVNFTAQVANATDTSVIWEVNGQAGGSTNLGFISTTGVYTAPASVPIPPTVTVSAVANADPTKSASAQITISTTPIVSVALNQSTVSLMAGQSFDFTATVSPISTPDPAVTWSLSCDSCGTITRTGADQATYTAPSTVSGTLNVTATATLTAHPTKTADAAISVTSPVVPTLVLSYSAAQAPVQPGGALSITAQVMNPPAGVDITITWPARGPGLFCINTDEPDEDNCGADLDDGGGGQGEMDGPGSFSPLTGGLSIYTAAPAVYADNPSQHVDTACSTSPLDPPLVYIPVIATWTVNGVLQTISASACLQLVPNN